MKYMLYLALISSTFFAYMKATKAFAKHCQKRLEPVEKEYEQATIEDEKEDILDLLSKMENNNILWNIRLRNVFVALLILITTATILIPMGFNIYNNVMNIIANRDNIILNPLTVGGVILLAVIIYKLIKYNKNKLPKLCYNKSLLRGMNDIRRICLSSGYNTQQELACVYPDRFPVARRNITAAMYRYEIYRLKNTIKEWCYDDPLMDNMLGYLIK